MCDEPHELVGKEVFFRVEIDRASNLPADLCKNVFVTYQFKHEPGVVYSTGEIQGQNPDPEFNYQHVHHIDLITDYIIDYIDSGNVRILSYFHNCNCCRLRLKCLLTHSSRSKKRRAESTDPSPNRCRRSSKVARPDLPGKTSPLLRTRTRAPARNRPPR